MNEIKIENEVEIETKEGIVILETGDIIEVNERAPQISGPSDKIVNLRKTKESLITELEYFARALSDIGGVGDMSKRTRAYMNFLIRAEIREY